jgi:hypothetical protein
MWSWVAHREWISDSGVVVLACSFAPPGLDLGALGTHGSRRGLKSYAAPRLQLFRGWRLQSRQPCLGYVHVHSRIASPITPSRKKPRVLGTPIAGREPGPPSSTKIVQGLGEQPWNEIGLGIGFIPGVVADAGIFRVFVVRAGGFEGSGHVPRFFDGHGIVGIAVEDPDGCFADEARDLGVGVALEFRGKSHAQLRLVAGSADSTAYRNEGGKAARMVDGVLPDSVSAHGKTGKVDAVAIAVKLFDRRVERGHRLGFDVGRAPVHFGTALRDHDHEGKSRAIEANGGGKAKAGLQQAVGAALARTVKKKNHWPGFFGVKIDRNIDLIAITFPRDFDGTVEKACLDAGRGAKRGREDRDENENSGARAGQVHGW